VDDVRALMRALGAKKSEISVYLALYRRGPATVRDLVERTGLSERTVRVALRSLLNGGYVSVEKSGRSNVYSAVSPSVISQKFRKKVEEYFSSMFTRLRSRSS